MDGPQDASLDSRIERLEKLMGELQASIGRLEATVAAQPPRPAPSSLVEQDERPAVSTIPPVPGAASSAEAPSQRASAAAPAVQVFCPNCRGGNPPNAPRCIWCNRPMPVLADLPRAAPAQGVGITEAAQAAPASRPLVDIADMRRSEFWLNKVGIALLVLGLAFLFKYSIDQGWLVPWVRVGFGLALGAALLGFGLRFRESRRHFAQVLMGGSVATLYVTGYAAYELLRLVPYEVAFGFMAGVTVLAFVLALLVRGVALSLVGLVGGLATPFLLQTDERNVPGLVAYVCLLLTGTVGVYFVRGWRSLLWVSFVGGWLVMLIASLGVVFSDTLADADRWALQGWAAFSLLAFWAVPVMRELLRVRQPERWPSPDFDPLDAVLPERTRGAVDLTVHLLTLLTPLFAVGFSMLVWLQVEVVRKEGWGGVVMAGALVFALVAFGLMRRAPELAYTHAAVALVLFTIGLTLLLEGDWLLLAVAAEAAALHFVSALLRRERGTSLAGHLLFVLIGMVLSLRLLTGQSGDMPVLNSQAVSDLAVVLLALGSTLLMRDREVVWTYRLAAHAAFLAWLWRELAALENGNAYVTIAWGVYALALLVLGIALGFNRAVMRVALGTLFVVVAKLFLVDLTLLEAIWRILLFLGFGGLFLVLSYLFQNFVKRTARSTVEPDVSSPTESRT